MKNKRGVGSANDPATRAGSPVPGHPTFSEMPDGAVTSGAEYQGANYGADMDLLGGEELDALLNGPGSFWDNVRYRCGAYRSRLILVYIQMLMPGFGGPIQGLNGGTLYPYSHEPSPWEAPRQSRPVSPFGGGGGNYEYHHHE